jgi:hypothetical protein
MLKLIIATRKHFSHAETGNFDHYTFHVMLKQTTSTMTHSKHAETDVFHYNIFQAC